MRESDVIKYMKCLKNRNIIKNVKKLRLVNSTYKR